MTTTEMEIAYLKQALRDVVQSNEAKKSIIITQNQMLIEKMAIIKSKDWMIKLLLMRMGN